MNNSLQPVAPINPDVPAAPESSAAGPAPPPSAALPPRPPKTWQFSLRTLLFWITFLSAVLWIAKYSGPTAIAFALWFAVLVVAHVAANRWGSRVPTSRDIGNLQPHHTPRHDRPTASLRPSDFHNDANPLHGRAVALRFSLACAAAGAVLGFFAGLTVFASIYWDVANLAAVLFGAISSAVLGAFAGGLAAAFYNVASTSFGDAKRKHDATVGRSDSSS